MKKFDELELENLGFKNVKKDDKKVFVALSANYGNIGDIGITIAQMQMIKDIYPDRKILEIPAINFYDYVELMKPIVNDDDIITLIGGGNMGNLYPLVEEYRRYIISNFPNNKMLSFPQSIDFNHGDNGAEELQKSVDIYGAHKNLTIFAREQLTYDVMKKNFKNDVRLVPDIVLYLKNKIELTGKKENISLCFRDDDEKITQNDIIKDLTNLLTKNNFENISIASTHLGDIIIKSYEKQQIFETLLNKFQKSKLVITDRLHGMIFSVITNTPCIAFDNSNKKISATYNTWLKGNSNVRLVQNYNEEEILNYVKELTSNSNKALNDFEENFKPLLQKLKEARKLNFRASFLRYI